MYLVSYPYWCPLLIISAPWIFLVSYPHIFEQKSPETASLPYIISQCRGGGRCADEKGQTTPSAIFHNEILITSGCFSNEVGYVFIP